MRISSKENFLDFTNSIALLLKVKLRLICIDKVSDRYYACIHYKTSTIRLTNCMVVMFFIKCDLLGFKLLFQDGKEVSRIQARLVTGKVTWEDLPYREMETLRQVGQKHWCKRDFPMLFVVV